MPHFQSQRSYMVGFIPYHPISIYHIISWQWSFEIPWFLSLPRSIGILHIYIYTSYIYIHIIYINIYIYTLYIYIHIIYIYIYPSIYIHEFHFAPLKIWGYWISFRARPWAVIATDLQRLWGGWAHALGPRLAGLETMVLFESWFYWNLSKTWTFMVDRYIYIYVYIYICIIELVPSSFFWI